MSAFYKIERALLDSVRALALPVQVEFPNTELDSDLKGDLWVKVSVLTAQTTVATLGSKGEDNNPGILQIDVNEIRGNGTKNMLDLIDTICTFYTAGKALQFGGESAKVTSASVSPLRYVDGYARRSVSINYYSRTFRS